VSRIAAVASSVMVMDPSAFTIFPSESNSNTKAAVSISPLPDLTSLGVV
jgi:hypothetical protein